MQQFQHPASEERVVRAGGGLEQRVAQDRNRVRLGLQGLAEGREQVRLLFRVRGHAERGGECLQWVHRCRGAMEVVVVETGGLSRCGRAQDETTGGQVRFTVEVDLVRLSLSFLFDFVEVW